MDPPPEGSGVVPLPLEENLVEKLAAVEAPPHADDQAGDDDDEAPAAIPPEAADVPREASDVDEGSALRPSIVEVILGADEASTGSYRDDAPDRRAASPNLARGGSASGPSVAAPRSDSSYAGEYEFEEAASDDLGERDEEDDDDDVDTVSGSEEGAEGAIIARRREPEVVEISSSDDGVNDDDDDDDATAVYDQESFDEGSDGGLADDGAVPRGRRPGGGRSQPHAIPMEDEDADDEDEDDDTTLYDQIEEDEEEDLTEGEEEMEGEEMDGAMDVEGEEARRGEEASEEEHMDTEDAATAVREDDVEMDGAQDADVDMGEDESDGAKKTDATASADGLVETEAEEKEERGEVPVPAVGERREVQEDLEAASETASIGDVLESDEDEASATREVPSGATVASASGSSRDNASVPEGSVSLEDAIGERLDNSEDIPANDQVESDNVNADTEQKDGGEEVEEEEPFNPVEEEKKEEKEEEDAMVQEIEIEERKEEKEGSEEEEEKKEEKEEEEEHESDQEEENEEDEDEEEEEDEERRQAEETAASLHREALLGHLERKYLALKATHESLVSTRASESAAASAREVEATKRSCALEREVDVATSRANRAEAERDTAKEQAAAVARRVAREEEESARGVIREDSLREEISDLRKSLRESQVAQRVARAEASLTSSASLPVQHSLERTERELSTSKEQATYLESELESRSTELRDVQRAASAKILSLSANLDRTTLECEEHEHANAALRSSLDAAAAERDVAASRLREMGTSAAETEEAFADHLDAQRRLVALHCERAEAEEEKAASAVRATEMAGHKIDEIERAWRERVAEAEAAAEEAREAARRAEGEAASAQHALALEKGRSVRRASVASATGGVGGAGRVTDVVALMESGASLSELYDRVVDAERDAQVERVERAKIQNCMTKIVADLEGKAPLLAAQRRESARLKESHGELEGRLIAALEEKEAARAALEDFVDERDRYIKTNRKLVRENQELGEQVQQLLWSRIGEEECDDSRAPLTFSNVKELQVQNQQLSRELNEISDTLKDERRQHNSEELRTAVQTAEEELSRIREDQLRQQQLVKGLAQQRDMYRTLLAKADASFTGDGGADAPPMLMSEVDVQAKTLASLRREVTELKERDIRNTDLIARLRDVEASISSDLAEAQREHNACRGERARLEADFKFYKERANNLESDATTLRGEVERSSRMRVELQGINVQLQKQLEGAEADLAKFKRAASQLQVKVRHLEVQKEASKTAEERTALENDSLRKELARNESLLDSVQRIEAGLTAKNSDESMRLVEEVGTLKKNLEHEKAKSAREIEMMSSSIAVMTDNKAALEATDKEAKEKESMLRLQLAESQSELGVLREQCAKCEARLLLLTRDGEEGIERARLAEIAEKDEKIGDLSASADALRAEISKTKEHVAYYKEIAKSNETALAELTATGERYQKEKALEIDNFTKACDKLKAEIESINGTLAERNVELAQVKSKMERAENDWAIKSADLGNQLSAALDEATAAKARLSVLERDTVSNLEAVRSAQENYERELQLHSEARTALRAVCQNEESEQKSRQAAELRVAAVEAELRGTHIAFEERRAKYEEAAENLEQQISVVGNQNTLLHAQMGSLADTLEKYQDDRSMVDGSNSTKVGEGANADEDVSGLQSSVRELRDVIKFMRKEKDIIDAKVKVLNHDIERERASKHVVTKALDEARAELKLHDNSGKDERSRDVEGEAAAAARLQQQLNLLRESNEMLREESQRAAAKLVEAERDLLEARSSCQPLEERARLLEAEMNTIGVERDVMSKQVDSWRERVTSLVEKYHQIDPNEHERLVELADKLEKDLRSEKEAKVKSEQSSSGAKSIIIKLNKDLAQNKAEVKQIKAELESEKMNSSRMIAEKEALKSSVQTVGSTFEKEREELKKKLLTAQSENLNSKQRLESLTRILKRNKGLIVDMNKKHKEEIDSLKLEQEKNTSVNQPLVVTTPSEPQSSASALSIQGLLNTDSSNSTKGNHNVPSLSIERSGPLEKIIENPPSETELNPEKPPSKVFPVASKPTPPLEVELPEGGLKFVPTKKIISLLKTTKGQNIDNKKRQRSDSNVSTNPKKESSTKKPALIAPPKVPFTAQGQASKMSSIQNIAKEKKMTGKSIEAPTSKVIGKKVKNKEVKKIIKLNNSNDESTPSVTASKTLKGSLSNNTSAAETASIKKAGNDLNSLKERLMKKRALMVSKRATSPVPSPKKTKVEAIQEEKESSKIVTKESVMAEGKIPTLLSFGAKTETFKPDQKPVTFTPFLNLKPPTSAKNSTPLTFGSSAKITLPVPTSPGGGSTSGSFAFANTAGSAFGFSSSGKISSILKDKKEDESGGQ